VVLSAVCAGQAIDAGITAQLIRAQHGHSRGPSGMTGKLKDVFGGADEMRAASARPFASRLSPQEEKRHCAQAKGLSRRMTIIAGAAVLHQFSKRVSP